MDISENLSGAKIVFLDTEFTGEHARATLVSLAMVTLDGDEFYACLNDYDQDQVSDWLRDNVLAHIDPATTVSSAQAYARLARWLEAYTEGKPLYVVSAGLLQDYILFLEMFRFACPERKYFHALHCLPAYLQHHAALDLNTLFRVCGVDPATDRAAFGGVSGIRHNALDDARAVRSCFLRLSEHPALHPLIRDLRR